MSTLPPYEWAIVLAGLIGITTTISVVLSRGALATGFSRSTATAVAWAFGIGWAGWALTSAALAGNDVYQFEPTRKLPLLPVRSARTFFIGLTFSPYVYHRCARGRMTFLCWWSIWSNGTPREPGRKLAI